VSIVFEYIQFARNFGPDYQQCVLRSKATQARFTRWGESVKIKMPHDTATQQLLQSPQFQRDAEIAVYLMKQMNQDFERAKKKFEKIATKPTSQGGGGRGSPGTNPVVNVDTDL